MPYSVQSVSAPIYTAIAAAKEAKSPAGKKVSHGEYLKISRAMDKALDDGFKHLSPQDTFEELPYAAGFGVMQSIKRSDFVKRADFTRLWNKAVDIASAAPDIGNYIP